MVKFLIDKNGENATILMIKGHNQTGHVLISTGSLDERSLDGLNVTLTETYFLESLKTIIYHINKLKAIYCIYKANLLAVNVGPQFSERGRVNLGVRQGSSLYAI